MYVQISGACLFALVPKLICPHLFFSFAATLLVWILCLLSSKTKSPGDFSSIKKNPSKGHPSPEKGDKRARDVFQKMRLVSPPPPLRLWQSLWQYPKHSKKCTPSLSSFCFYGFMQIVFNKSVLIQGPQVQAGRRKVTLRRKYSLHAIVMEKTLFFFSHKQS